MQRPTSKYDHLPSDIYSTSSIRKLDRQAIENIGDEGFTLMYRAGVAAFNQIQKLWPGVNDLCVMAGAGNNGGDAWVVAALAKQQGFAVCLYYLGDVSEQSSSAQKAKNMAINAGVEAFPFTRELNFKGALIVDGLLGIGLSTIVRAKCAQAIQAINKHPAQVLALDVPSGLNADTGEVMGEAVKADHTITYIGLKPGLLTGEGPDFTGQLQLDELDVLTSTQKYKSAIQRVSLSLLQDKKLCLKKRKGNSHKGMFGHALLIGGDTGMGGAICLAVDACSYTGAGMTSCATQGVHVPVILNRRPECMARTVESGLELGALLEKVSVIGCGPGLGNSSWSELLLQQVLLDQKPLVLDADALNILASPGWQMAFIDRDAVVTPHPGEAARLLGISVAQVQQHRERAARDLAEKLSAVVILKGQGTVIAAPNGQVAICSHGNSGMASAGMGDVLTGVITALLAQGMDSWNAACYGACLHSAAADLAVQELGSRGLQASELLPYIRQLVNL